MIKFPDRVWFQTAIGWASRVPTKEDIARRKEYIKRASFRLFTKLLAESSKNPERKLRRGE